MISVTALGELLIDFTDAGVSEGARSSSSATRRCSRQRPRRTPARLGLSTAFIGKVAPTCTGSFSSARSLPTASTATA